MDTLLREPVEISDLEILEVPTGILTHDPLQAEPGAEHVWPEVSGEERPTYLHPMVLVTAAGGYAWTLLVFWVVFWGYGYMGVSMTVATLISCMMLGLLAAGGAGGRVVTPWQRPWRSFREFLASDVEVWSGRVSGRDAFIQLAGMSWCLAALATVFGIIIEASRTT
jgi:hypothetical protein